ADIARTDVSPLAGATAAIAVLIILIIAMAGLGIAVVNALADSAWATFTIFITIPLAVFMGFYMFRWRTGRTQEATIIGVTILFLGVVLGKNVAESSIGHWFVLTHHQVTAAMALYTVAAAILPVWMLLDNERDIRTVGYGAMLVEGVVGIVALITAASLNPNDYYAINTTPDVFRTLGVPVVDLPDLQAQVGEVVAGRPGGAVSLAV